MMTAPTLAPVAGNTPRTRPENLTRYPALDGIRALAFLMVMMTHYYGMPWGFGGVNIFFVLSGFLITGILYDSRDRPDRVRSFYIRRTLRIFPLYYGVLLVLLLTTPVFHWRWKLPWIAWPLYVGNFLRLWAPHATDFAHLSTTFAWLASRWPNIRLNLGHFWSLCVEEQFYLFWPWLVFWMYSRRRLLVTCTAVVLLCPVLRAVVQAHAPAWTGGSREMVYAIGVPFQLDALLLGALLALLWRGAYRHHLQRISTILLGTATCLLVAYIVRIRVLHPHGLWDGFDYPTWRITWGLSLIDLYGALLMVCALRPGSLTYRIFDLRPLRALGRISYGAYVFHDMPHPIYWFAAATLIRHLHLHHFTQMLTLFFALTGTIVLASLSYRFFETPFLNLKERWAPSRRFVAGD